jgi:hypothetical protein
MCSLGLAFASLHNTWNKPQDDFDRSGDFGEK